MPIKHAVHWYSQIPLTTLVGPIAGATIGYFVSKRQNRLERDTRQRTVAGALAAEVTRIRTALGADARDHRAPDPIFYGLTFEPPQIHPWLARVIVDAAEISPVVVSDFMALERELRHFATLLGQWREAAAAATAATATPTRVAAIVGGPSAVVAAGAAPSGPVAERARDRARNLYEECVATQRMAVKVLDRLEATLTPVLDSSTAPRRDDESSPPPPPPARAAGSGMMSWRGVKKRLRRAGVTILADFGLGDGWPEENAPAKRDNDG